MPATATRNLPTMKASVTTDHLLDLVNSPDSTLIDTDAELKFTYAARVGRVAIVDLSNAMKRGAECVSYQISETNRDDILDGRRMRDALFGFRSVAALFRYLSQLDFPDNGPGFPDHIEFTNGGQTFRIYRRTTKAIRVFSPLHLHRLKPLKSEPKKWNVRLATRAVVNGQFEWLRCDGQYSDDYRRDAARNYGKGEIENHLDWIANIIERPRGWRVWVTREGNISINCHSFDTNTFKPSID